MSKLSIICALLAVGVLLPQISLAEMTSTNFRVWGDMVGGVGGGRSAGATFTLDAEGGEFGGGESSGAAYRMIASFQALQERPTFSFTLSSSSVGFSRLSDSSVSSVNQTLTTSTNAPYGYVTSIVEDGELTSGSADIDDVADGTVTAGSEEYGVAVSGTDAAFGTDQPITTTPLVVAARTTWKNGAATVLTYKASIDALTPDGTYTHNVTIISTGQF